MRRVSVVVLLVLSLCLATAMAYGEDKPDVSIEDLIAANRTSALLSRYDSFRVAFETFFEGGESYSIYLDGANVYYDSASSRGVTSRDLDYWRYPTGEGDTAVYCKRLDCTGDGFSLAAYGNCFLDEANTANEQIVECARQQDALKLVTQMSEEATAAFLSYFVEVAPGDALVVEYILDFDTLAILGGIEKIKRADGSTADFCGLDVTHNAPKPDALSELIARANRAEDVCTVSVVVDPGSASQRAYSMTLPRGDIPLFSLPEGYALYADEALATEYAALGEPAQSDITLYAGAAAPVKVDNTTRKGYST